MSVRRRKFLTIEQCWLYSVSSPTDLARRLSTARIRLTVDVLKELAKDAGNFRVFQCRTESKARAIQEPKPFLQAIHKRIHTLLSRVQVPDYLHSAVRGRSYLTNALAHNPTAPIIKIDVKKFFASVPREAIKRFFCRTMKCRSDVSALLADLLSYEGHLPTGSSASPVIAYYAFKPMFDQIAELARSNDLTMTCYVDDMTLSGPAANRSLLYTIHQTIADHGLRSHKMRVFSADQPRVITGVCSTPTGQRVPNRSHLKIKKSFDALRAAATPLEKETALRALLGRLYAAGQIEPKFTERARTLRDRMRREDEESGGRTLEADPIADDVAAAVN